MKTILIAHRGEPDHWPENSLAGFRAALAAGAHYLETDIQLTADAVPVLSHDPTLLRVTGHDLEIARTPWTGIAGLSAGEPGRFGARFADQRILRLDEFVALLRDWPGVHAFIEIKRDCLQAFGATRVLDIVLDCLAPAMEQCILISFVDTVLAEARRQHGLPIGWILPEWSDSSARIAGALEPDYLFCNRKRLPPPPVPLWKGPWQWVVYTVNERAEIQPLLARGFRLVETNRIGRLLAEAAAGEAADG